MVEGRGHWIQCRTVHVRIRSPTIIDGVRRYAERVPRSGKKKKKTKEKESIVGEERRMPEKSLGRCAAGKTKKFVAVDAVVLWVDGRRRCREMGDGQIGVMSWERGKRGRIGLCVHAFFFFNCKRALGTG